MLLLGRDVWGEPPFEFIDDSASGFIAVVVGEKSVCNVAYRGHRNPFASMLGPMQYHSGRDCPYIVRGSRYSSRLIAVDSYSEDLASLESATDGY